MQDAELTLHRLASPASGTFARLGEAAVDLAKHPLSLGRAMYLSLQLQDHGHTRHPKLQLSVQWQANAKINLDDGVLQVHFKKAELPGQMDIDPYAELMFGEQTLRSEIIRETTSPEWDAVSERSGREC